MKVTVYVEGGGDSAQLKERCRKGFKDLLTKAGVDERLLKVVSCGPRDRAFRSFRNALRLRRADEYLILLVDSEELVADANQPDVNPSGAWRHLARRDGDLGQRPPGANDDQAQLMVTTMETWLIADRQALRAYFPGINENALPPDSDLESRSKPDIERRFADATRPSSKGAYHKGKHSFDLLGRVDPAELMRRLPHFQRFVAALESRLSAP